MPSGIEENIAAAQPPEGWDFSFLLDQEFTARASALLLTLAAISSLFDSYSQAMKFKMWSKIMTSVVWTAFLSFFSAITLHRDDPSLEFSTFLTRPKVFGNISILQCKKNFTFFFSKNFIHFSRKFTSTYQ